MREKTILKVVVERVCYPRKPEEDNPPQWYIIRAYGEEGELVSAKGSLAWRPKEGERLILDGQWVEYQGKMEFQFSFGKSDIPCNPRDLLHYAIEMTDGMGEAMEAWIWAEYGEDWQEIVNDDPPNNARYKRLHAAFCETVANIYRQREMSEAMSWLMARGSTKNMAMVAWNQWKLETISTVESDPYRLTDLPHYGFVHVDTMIARKHFGIGIDDPRRIHAGIIYAMSQATDSGSSAIEWGALKEILLRCLDGVSIELIVSGVKQMFGTELNAFHQSKRIAFLRHLEADQDILNYAEGKSCLN